MGLIDTKDMDIVYVTKARFENEELRYSLRTLKNIPHRKVFIFGACPPWVKNVQKRGVVQNENKWANVNHLLRVACRTEAVSDNFILMNDDFFINKKINGLDYYYCKNLEDRIEGLSDEVMNPSKYMLNLAVGIDILKEHNSQTKNFELHVPMIFNKYKLYPILKKYPDSAARRSIYANMYNIEGKETTDCKVYGLMAIPDARRNFLSTTDASFRHGLVGKYIRTKFKDKSKYER